MSVGALSGLTFLPFLLDRYGRKPVLIGGAILMIIGIILQTAAQNIGMFVGARFVLGLGDIIVICTFPMLITEIAPSQDRAVLVTIATTTYNVGAFIAAWVTFGTFRINVCRAQVFCYLQL
jgi:MFS family permease